jgi:hypothetical protein
MATEPSGPVVTYFNRCGVFALFCANPVKLNAKTIAVKINFVMISKFLILFRNSSMESLLLGEKGY